MIEGIIGIKNNKLVIGSFKESHDNIVIHGKGRYSNCVLAKNYDIVKDLVFFSTLQGRYFWRKDFSSYEVFKHTACKGVGLYPYNFPKAYEAINHFDLFSGQQSLKYHYNFLGASSIPYTFGLEYETSMGCVPEPICFRDGLIPLRDGSITGPEYSTVVLAGNDGINMIYQQVETLKKYTHFNKECSLHMHLGGYPVNKSAIFTLYSLCLLLESDFMRMTNRWVFQTGAYKNSGKDYCNALPEYANFDEMYFNMVGKPFEGSLTDPHPADREREQKWHINARYRDVNLINMLCYKSPKTVEFRFLRPTYNFTKIYTWLLIFSAILKFAETMYNKYGECATCNLVDNINKEGLTVCIRDIVKYIYNEKVASELCDRITELEMVSILQAQNEDYAGNDTTFEDELMTFSFR